MQTELHLTQIAMPRNGKLIIEIPVADEEAGATFRVTIDVMPQPPTLTAEEQADFVDRLFGSIPDLPEPSAGGITRATIRQMR